jgi:hypothetical protein
MKAEILSLHVQVEVIAEALARLGRKIIAAGLRRAEQTKPHRLSRVVARARLGAGIERVFHGAAMPTSDGVMLRTHASDTVAVQISDHERALLVRGLLEWGGPTRPTDALARAMGSEDVAGLLADTKRVAVQLEVGEPLTAADIVEQSGRLLEHDSRDLVEHDAETFASPG